MDIIEKVKELLQKIADMLTNIMCMMFRDLSELEKTNAILKENLSQWISQKEWQQEYKKWEKNAEEKRKHLDTDLWAYVAFELVGDRGFLLRTGQKEQEQDGIDLLGNLLVCLEKSYQQCMEEKKDQEQKKKFADTKKDDKEKNTKAQNDVKGGGVIEKKLDIVDLELIKRRSSYDNARQTWANSRGDLMRHISNQRSGERLKMMYTTENELQINRLSAEVGILQETLSKIQEMVKNFATASPEERKRMAREAGQILQLNNDWVKREICRFEEAKKAWHSFTTNPDFLIPPGPTLSSQEKARLQELHQMCQMIFDPAKEEQGSQQRKYLVDLLERCHNAYMNEDLAELEFMLELYGQDPFRFMDSSLHTEEEREKRKQFYQERIQWYEQEVQKNDREIAKIKETEGHKLWKAFESQGENPCKDLLQAQMERIAELKQQRQKLAEELRSLCDHYGIRFMPWE